MDSCNLQQKYAQVGSYSRLNISRYDFPSAASRGSSRRGNDMQNSRRIFRTSWVCAVRAGGRLLQSRSLPCAHFSPIVRFSRRSEFVNRSLMGVAGRVCASDKLRRCRRNSSWLYSRTTWLRVCPTAMRVCGGALTDRTDHVRTKARKRLFTKSEYRVPRVA